MTSAQPNSSGLMVPQILFQCYHCRVVLKVPISLAGQSGPCPQCGQPLQTPLLATSFVAEAVVEEQQVVKRHANPAMTYATDAPSLLGRSFSNTNSSPRSLNRGIMADQSISRDHLMKKENRQSTRMIVWFVLVILFLAAATYLMKSYVVGG